MTRPGSHARRRVAAIARCGCLLLGALAAACAGERPTRVVLITIDTLRYDSFAGGDGRESSMPRTLAYARRGHIFRNLYAATSATQPTHATLFTGLHPWRHGVTRNGLVLASGYPTLAERLRDAGYATAAVVASFPLHHRFGFARGFDEYEEEFEIATGSGVWEGEEIAGGGFYSPADSVTARAIAMLERAPGPRQFFWFHYFDPHSPYGDRNAQRVTVPKLLDVAKSQPARVPVWLRRARRLYEDDVAFLDRSLARLLERLDADGDRVDTHVVFTADHGESFGEDGSFGHGERVTRAQVHVPGFIVSPRLGPAVRRDTAGSADLAATVLSLAGVAPAGIPGRDLSRPAAAESGRAFGMRRGYDPPHLARRSDGSTVVLAAPVFYAVMDGTLWAGDASGIAEGELAAAPAPPEPLAEQLRILFGGFAGSLSQSHALEDPDPETRRALEALGYTR